MVGDKIYRIEGRRTDDNKAFMDLLSFRIVKETPKGVWIELWNGAPRKGGQKFILNKSRKKYAYAKIEDARSSFIIRKKRQIQYLKNSLQTAIGCLYLCESGADFGAKVDMIELFDPLIGNA